MAAEWLYSKWAHGHRRIAIGGCLGITEACQGRHCTTSRLLFVGLLAKVGCRGARRGRPAKRRRGRDIASKPFRDALHRLLLLDPVQNLAPKLGAGEGLYYGVALALLLTKGLDLSTQALLGLADRHFVYTLDVFLRFTSATGPLAIALQEEKGSQWVSGECHFGHHTRRNVWVGRTIRRSRHRQLDGLGKKGMVSIGFRLRRTLARFFLHSVQALGVTTPKPLRRLDCC